MYKVNAIRAVPSTHCFCRLFLEIMAPMRPAAAKPTPAMPTATMASLTCKREEGGSDSVRNLRTGCTFNKNIHLREPHMPLGLLNKLRSQQILARKWGEEGRMGKELGDGASWPGICLDGNRETRFALRVFKAHKSQRVSVERTGK